MIFSIVLLREFVVDAFLVVFGLVVVPSVVLRRLVCISAVVTMFFSLNVSVVVVGEYVIGSLLVIFDLRVDSSVVLGRLVVVSSVVTMVLSVNVSVLL